MMKNNNMTPRCEAAVQVSLYKDHDKSVLHHSSRLPLAAIGLSMLLIAGCAAKKPEITWQQDREKLQSQLNKVGMSQATLAEQVQALNKQLAELEARMASHEAMQEMSLDQHETRFIELEEKIEALKKTSGSNSKTAAKRKSKPQETARATNEPVVSKINNATPPPEPTPVISDEEIKGFYVHAYLASKSGRYEQASTDFNNFLVKFPGSTYTHQAEYWLGESLHAQGNTIQAAEAFQKAASTAERNPQQNAALLRLGQLYMELERKDDARITFLSLINEHPQSSEAEAARKTLAELITSTSM